MDQYSDIKKPAFQGAIGAVFGVAVVSAIARFVIRLLTRRPFYWDDFALCIATASLSAATGIALKNCNGWFLGNQLQQDPASAFLVPPEELNNLISNSSVYLYSFLALSWTTIFAVKMSFLIFFKQLIQRLGKINIYFWGVTGTTVLSWMFLVAEPFILCPYFGFDSLQCYGPSRDKLYVSMTALITALDVMTDLMIASIPILVLRKSQIPNKQKIILACFLCLSLVMTTLAIIRVSKIHGSSNVDVVWEIFWQWMEAGVAVTMASVTAFRTIVQNKGQSQQKRWEPSVSWIQRMKLKRSEKSVDAELDLPPVPRGTLSGLRTFIRKNNRSVGATTVMQTDLSLSNMLDTRCDTLDEEREGHVGSKSITVTKGYEIASAENPAHLNQPFQALTSQQGNTTTASRSYASYGRNTLAATEHGSIYDPPQRAPSFV